MAVPPELAQGFQLSFGGQSPEADTVARFQVQVMYGGGDPRNHQGRRGKARQGRKEGYQAHFHCGFRNLPSLEGRSQGSGFPF